jgi:hypothetical protein
MPARVRAEVPMRVPYQRQRLPRRELGELVGTGAQRMPRVGCRSAAHLRDRTHRRKGGPVGQLRERPRHRYRQAVSLHRHPGIIGARQGRTAVSVTVEEVVRGVRRAFREVIAVERSLNPVRDIGSGHLAAVLESDSAPNCEGPRREVRVGRPGIGGDVRHQHHLPARGAVRILRQRARHQPAEDGARVGIVRGCGVQRAGHRGGEDGHRAAGRGPWDRDCGRLPVRVDRRVRAWAAGARLCMIAPVAGGQNDQERNCHSDELRPCDHSRRSATMHWLRHGLTPM